LYQVAEKINWRTANTTPRPKPITSIPATPVKPKHNKNSRKSSYTHQQAKLKPIAETKSFKIYNEDVEISKSFYCSTLPSTVSKPVKNTRKLQRNMTKKRVTITRK
jgi:hypothetical protein